MNSKELKTREQIDKNTNGISAMICDESSVNSDLDSIKTAQKNMRQTTQEDLQKCRNSFGCIHRT